MVWNLAQFGEQQALLEESGASLSYEQLHAASDEMVQAVGKRCLVFSLCRNTIGSVVGYTAFLNHGIPPVLLSSELEQHLLERLLRLYQPAFLWLPEEQADRFPGMGAAFRGWGYCLLRTGYEMQYPLCPQLGLLLTTSGSTGSPKLVRQSYENILDNARAIAAYLELDASERPITTLPMHYTYGLSIINSHLLTGGTLLLTEKGLMQREFWTFLQEAEATSFGGVPYTYEMLDRLRFYRRKLPSLRTMTQAGGKLSPALHEKLANYARESGKHFVVMYGQCEATARMAYLPPERAAEKIGSIGIAIPGGELYLVDDEGNKIHQPHRTGELIYRGKNVTLGYAERGEDLIRGDERRGVLETGDLAQMDEDGYFYIVGRKKRFIKVYGNRVNLDELDQMVREEFCTEAACAGVDDHICIFVTGEGLTETVRAFVAQKTRLNPAAFRVEFLKELPKNEAGKILYAELKQRYLQGQI